MSKFNAVSGQSLLDVCLNCYGSLDYLGKLITDNNIANLDTPVVTGMVFDYDNSLVVDQNIQRVTTLSGKIFATVPQSNSNTYYVVSGGGSVVNPNAPATPSFPAKTYTKTSSTYYVATGGESDVSLPALQGCTILQIERNIQPLKPSDFSFDTITGNITILTDSLSSGETLFILYNQVV